MARACDRWPQDQRQVQLHGQALTSPDEALAFARFLRFAALLWLWGAQSYLAALVPRVVARPIAGRLQPVTATMIAVGVAATLVTLPIEAARVGDGWPDAIRWATIDAVLFDTSIGFGWRLQTAAAGLVTAAGLSPRRWRTGALAVAAGLSLVSSTFSGHAVMQAAELPRVAHQVNDALHLLADGAWFGALTPLWIILRRLTKPADHAAKVIALRRFSTAGHAVVALVIVTGIGNDLLIVGGWPFDWGVPYQALLSVKIALVVSMTVLALVNRYGVVPRFSTHPSAAIRNLRLGTVLEICLGAAVVALAAVVGMLEPDR